jgi:hypothetical protein
MHVEVTSYGDPEITKRVRLDFQKGIQVWKEQDFNDVEKRIKTQYDELYKFTKPFIDAGLRRAGLKSARREDMPRPRLQERPDPTDGENDQR